MRTLLNLLMASLVYRNEYGFFQVGAAGPEIEMMRKQQFNNFAAGFSLLALALLAIAGVSQLRAQAAGQRFVGTITAIADDSITVKTDAGEVRQVKVPSTAIMKRIEPGQRDLAAAVTIQLSDLATGDRVLVRLDAAATDATPVAAQIVTIKAADVAARQQKEREEWQRTGVGGLVKSVDPAMGVVVLTSGAGPALKVITVHVGKSTVLKRYAPASVRFDLAQPAPIDAIHVGDQLRARGTKNADGTELDADEVVSGSFRNISGIISSLDASNSTFVVKDLLTRKPVTIHITPDAQMHALPEMMAQMIAARLKGSANGAASGGNGSELHTHAASGNGNSRWAGQGHGQSGDLQQVLNRAPVIQFADLKKGEAVMLVSTAGDGDVTAITLLTGVEPLLQAPEASQNLLSSWSMGSGGASESESQ